MIHLPSRRNVASAVRDAYASGRDVHVVSKTARPKDLRRCLQDLGEWRPEHWTSAHTGDGWTVTFFLHRPTAQPFAYWPKSRKDEPRWVWACRACGTADERWVWRDVDEAAPLIRQAYVLSKGQMVDVPWSCPRTGCHGAPRWHRAA